MQLKTTNQSSNTTTIGRQAYNHNSTVPKADNGLSHKLPNEIPHNTAIEVTNKVSDKTAHSLPFHSTNESSRYIVTNTTISLDTTRI